MIALSYSDRKLLYRILQNFLANAIRYTERGGVLLGCRLRGEHLRFSVWDTGVGIEEADSEAIFQEFHRLGIRPDGSTRKDSASGWRFATVLPACWVTRSASARGRVTAAVFP